MRIIGFNFDKISIERKKEIKGKLEIKTNLNILDITKENVELVKEDILKFKFSFDIIYEPGFVNLTFNGSVMVIIPPDKIKEIIKQWKKKKILEYVRMPLFNFILTKCNLRALNLEEEFNLPLHVPMPKLQSAEAVQPVSENRADYVR